MSRNVLAKDIKMLYGLSADRCNICGIKLHEPKENELGYIHLGEMAHNIAYSAHESAPRAIDGKSGDNSYENLILLCALDHERIDQNPAKYTIDYLKKIKKEFENHVDNRLDRTVKPDTYMVKGAYSLINVQSVLNSLDCAPSFIHSDVTDWGDLYNEFFLKNSPSLYPFQDVILQELTEKVSELYFELSQYLFYDNQYIYNHHTHVFKMNHDLDLSKLCNLLRESLSEWIIYTREHYLND
ncbi:HNH endonuclease [Acinetobacter pittii]|uniref:HNH endonuclease n=1 Tax=Acinetobacter pittii TaxID=48296 RepID=UPI00355B3E1C